MASIHCESSFRILHFVTAPWGIVNIPHITARFKFALSLSKVKKTIVTARMKPLRCHPANPETGLLWILSVPLLLCPVQLYANVVLLLVYLLHLQLQFFDASFDLLTLIEVVGNGISPQSLGQLVPDFAVVSFSRQKVVLLCFKCCDFVAGLHLLRRRREILGLG